MKALITYNYGEENMQKIRELGYDIMYKSERDIEYQEEFADVDVLICYDPFK